MSTYSIQVKWPGDTSFTDLTSVADRDYSYDFYAGGPDFKFVKNTFELSLVYTTALALKVLSLSMSDLVPVTVDKNGVRLFTGFLLPISGQEYASWKRSTITLMAQDPSLALDTELSSPLVYANNFLCNTSNTGLSLLHKLFAMGTASVSHSAPHMATSVASAFDPVSNNYLPLFIAKKGDNLLQLLSELIWQQGWVWWFDANGVAQFRSWTSAVSTSITFNTANENTIDGSFSIEKKNFVEDSVQVDFLTSGHVDNIAVDGLGWSAFKNNDTSQAFDFWTTNPQNIVGAKSLYPTTDKTTLVIPWGTSLHVTLVCPMAYGTKTLSEILISTIQLYFVGVVEETTTVKIGKSIRSILGVNSYYGTSYYYDTATGTPTTVSTDGSGKLLGSTISGFTSVNGVVNFDINVGAAPAEISSGVAHVKVLVPKATGVYQTDILDGGLSCQSKVLGAKARVKKYSMVVPSVQSMADILATWIKANLIDLAQAYSLSSYVDYSIGVGVAIDIGGISVSGLLYKKAYSETARKYSYKIKQLSAVSSGSTVITAPTSSGSNSLVSTMKSDLGYTYWVEASDSIVYRSENGVCDPPVIAFSAYKQIGGGNGAPIMAQFKVYEFIGGSWVLMLTSGRVSYIDYTISGNALTGVKVEMISYGVGTALTTIEVQVVQVQHVASVTLGTVSPPNIAGYEGDIYRDTVLGLEYVYEYGQWVTPENYLDDAVTPREKARYQREWALVEAEMKSTRSMAQATSILGGAEWSSYNASYNNLRDLLFTTAGSTPPVLSDYWSISVKTGIGINITAAKNQYESALATLNAAILTAINSSASNVLQPFDCGQINDGTGSVDIDCGVYGDTWWASILETTIDCGTMDGSITETIDCGTTGTSQDTSNWPSDYTYDCGAIAVPSGTLLPDEVIDCGIFNLFT